METCCSTYGVIMPFTEKEIAKIKDSIRKTKTVDRNILGSHDSCTIAQLIEKLEQYDPNTQIELSACGSDYCDVNLFILKEVPRTEKEIEADFKRAIKRAEGEKNRVKKQEEKDRKAHERLKKKFEGKVTE